MLLAKRVDADVDVDAVTNASKLSVLTTPVTTTVEACKLLKAVTTAVFKLCKFESKIAALVSLITKATPSPCTAFRATNLLAVATLIVASSDI